MTGGELLPFFKIAQGYYGNASFAGKFVSLLLFPVRLIKKLKMQKGGERIMDLQMRRYAGGSLRNGGSGSNKPREFPSVNDRYLQENITRLNQSRDELANISKLIQKALNLPSDTGRGILARIMHLIFPKSLYSVLPAGITKLVAEEYDVLELIERLQRQNIDNVQDALKELAACAIAKRQELNEFEADIETAQKEKWDAQRLQQYMAKCSGVEIYDVVSRILSMEFNALSDEEKEKRKEDLLNQIQSTVVIGEELMETIGKVCSAGLQVFHKGTVQYFNYVNFYRPVAVIRDSAKTLVDMNQSMYAAKDALVATFESSVQAIELAVDAATMVNNYSIVSPDMQGLLKAGQERLDRKLKALKAANENATLKKPPVAVADKTDATVIETVAVN